jgi:hypothetical protein
MARLIIEGSDLVVALSGLERLGALHKDVRVPLTPKPRPPTYAPPPESNFLAFAMQP